MNNKDESLDLLDLDDDAELDTIPAASPFETPRPKRPWLLMGLGLLVIVLATYIIVRAVGTSNDSSSVEIDLDAPAVVTIDGADGTDTLVVPDAAPAPTPSAVTSTPTPAPVREVADRNNNVTFNPDKPAPVAKPAAQPAPKPKPAAKPAPKPAPAATAVNAKKPAAAPAGSWYVQFGSYGTQAGATAAQKKMQAMHSGLLGGKQFVIQSAQVNGKTTYRLRVAFANQNDANMFCRNAKSDGLDCYVAR